VNLSVCVPGSSTSLICNTQDQFRRDHPLPEEQGKDVGLKEAPQDGGTEEGRGDETSVRPEGPGGSQDMQVGMPVQ
jgi:hypothetical protein